MKPRFHKPGCGSRKDNIIRALKFIKIFYDLKPTGAEVTLDQIRERLDCSRTNARHWRDVAGEILPIAEVGDDKYRSDRERGPAAILYGVLR